MVTAPLGQSSLQHFNSRLQGELIGMSDAGYDHARSVWNGRIDKYPALILRCADLTDVLAAVQFAGEQDMTVAIRGGGHSLVGHSVCDGGMVIDLSRMKDTWVDPVKKIVQAQAGLTLGEFIHATQAWGLATPVGNVAGTGLSGLTLGGGLGWLMGKYGFTIDNLLSVDLVTADGHVLTASANEHPDLFWAVRGGGGNFGIATSFEFRLHPVGPILAGKVVYPISRAREVLRFYRDYTRKAPDALTAYASLMTRNGLPVIAISLCYTDNLEEGERVVAPVRKFGSSLVDLIRPKSYLSVLSTADAGAPPGRSYYEKACTLTELSDEAIEAIAAYGATCTSPFSQLLIQHVHGAASRVAPTETAFALREESYVICIRASWEDVEADSHIAWADACWTAMEPFATSGVYVNFLADDGDTGVRACYRDNYERLVALKNRYDPTNFFHINQNIKPSR